MKSPDLRRDLALLAVLGLAVNAFAAGWVSLPGYMDAYYYFGGAVQLARGHGLTEPYLWNYLSPRDPAADAAHRWPSHLYWMPLTSFVVAPFIFVSERLAGDELPHATLFRAGQIPLVLAAAALPLVSYGVARHLTGRRRHAWAAALLTLFSAFYFVYWTATDAFALFALAASTALGLAGLAAQRPDHAGRLLTLAGLAAGLAHLARADGLLVVLCVLFWWLGSSAAVPYSRTRLLPMLGMLLAYSGVMLPWFARNLAIIGSPVAPGAARTLWLTNYDDFFTYDPARLNAAAFWASGWGSILAGKLGALRDNLGTLLAVQASVVALPFAALGAWRLRRQPMLHPAGLYGLTLFLVMTFIFTFPGARGGYFHSGAALLPFLLTAAVVGLDAAVEAVARRLPHWQPERAKPVFTIILVGIVISMALALFGSIVIGPNWREPAWGRRDAVYAEAGRWLAAAGEGETAVAVNNPPGWYYLTGQPGIVIPAGDNDTLLRAMDSVGAPWVLLDANRPAGLAGLYSAPGSDPRLTLVVTFTDNADRAVFLLRRVAP